MLGQRTYSESATTLLQQKPPFTQQQPLHHEKKKRSTIRKKINSVKSFFADKHKSTRQGSLSRNASMPDIYAAMNGSLGQLSPENRKYSLGVPMRDKSSRHGGKLNLRPRSECLEFIDENESLTPTLPWMRRHMEDCSPASTISTRSEVVYRPPLVIAEQEEELGASPSSPTHSHDNFLGGEHQTHILKTTDSFDSLISDGLSSLDENHNDIPLFPKFPTPDTYSHMESSRQEISKSTGDLLQKNRNTNNKNNAKLPDKSASSGNLERNLPVRKSKSFQHQSKKEIYPELPNKQIKYYSAEAEDIRKRKKSATPSLDVKDLRILMEFEAERVLAGCCYDAKTAAKWSKEISGSIRERLRSHTNRGYKIVVNTFIGTVMDQKNGHAPHDNVHVACRSETDPTTDRFIVTALKTDELFVAITLLLLKY